MPSVPARLKIRFHPLLLYSPDKNSGLPVPDVFFVLIPAKKLVAPHSVMFRKVHKDYERYR